MLLACSLVTIVFWITTLNANPLWRNTTGFEFPDLLDVELEHLERGLYDGLFTSVDLTIVYIQRILEVNDVLHAVTEINPEAVSIAANLDVERAAGRIRGPLHGIPILLKNNIATSDLLNNTAGSFGLLGAKVPSDSTLASKLRAAGAVILGKSNLSQWANFRSSNSTNGWSAYGGQTKGAYYPDQDPSGSSSGSAVASSLGLAFASLGSETSGSILSPSSYNNVVGIKPTVGLTSRNLVIPISEHQDTVGPIARTVKDAAYVLQAIAGKDPADNYTLAQPFESLPDYVAAACNYSAFKGARIGVPRNLINTSELVDDTVLNAFEAALSLIESAGAEIIDNTNITAYALDQYTDGESENIVLGADFVRDLPDNYLSKLVLNPQQLTDLTGVRKFTQTFKPEDFPDRDTDVWDQALRLGFDNTSPKFWTAYQTNLQIAGPEGITGLLANFSLDALVLPTDFAPGLPALIGSPVVTVPLGAYPPTLPVKRNDRGSLVETGPNIPFGISFLGAKWSEEALIGFAAAFEKRTRVRSKISPYLSPQTQLIGSIRQIERLPVNPVAVV